MNDWIPLLQVIHVSDLHFCDSFSDKQKLLSEKSRCRLRLRQLTEELNIGEFHEGTLGHESVAVEEFENFLRGYVANDRTWFGSGARRPPTWLIDTGDATVFGDPGSIRLAQAKLKSWQQILHDCPARLMYGNHDVWPAEFPFWTKDYKEVVKRQQELLQASPDWHERQWRVPLVVEADDGPRIECYGCNTVSFGRIKNTLALGTMNGADLDALCKVVDRQSRARAFRILATHHPLAFPYERKDIRAIRAIPKMKLLCPRRALARLSRAAHADVDQPYIHLFLSGHTHSSYPAGALPPSVESIHMHGLAPSQLQLVGGPLLQVLDTQRAQVQAQGGKPAGRDWMTKNVKRFSLRGVCVANQQFQILQFSYRRGDPHTLQMRRCVFVRLPNLRGGYVQRGDWESHTRMQC